MHAGPCAPALPRASVQGIAFESIHDRYSPVDGLQDAGFCAHLVDAAVPQRRRVQ